MIDTLIEQFLAQSGWEVLAVVCALLYVHFATRQHLACWPFALANTALYTWLFWETSLFFQSLLNAWYMVMAVYGWFNWKRLQQQDSKGVVSWGVKNNLAIIVGLSCVSVFGFQLLQAVVEEKLIFLDLLIAVFSAFVTWMLAQKVLENWLYWVAINICTVWLCWQQGLLLTAVLFVIYVGYAVKGYFDWRRESTDRLQMTNSGSALS